MSIDATTAPRSPLPAYALFFLSGAAGLIDEVSWARQVGLVLGQSGHTAAVVLASYFCGMALGYMIAARWCHRVNPLWGYGVAELLAGIWAAMVPTLLDLARWGAPSILVDHPSLAIRTVWRCAIGFATILPGAVALGASLPFMAHHLGRRRDGSGRVAFAYSLNTFGALAGVVAATAVLLMVVGVRGSGYLAAGISAACGLAALAMAGGRECPIPLGFVELVHLPWTREASGWLAVVALSGFGTLALEVLYMRMFALVYHNSTYTFGLVVALFLLGLAIGSAIAAWSRADPARLAGWASLLGAASIAVILPAFAWSTAGFAYFGVGRTFAAYLAGAFLFAAPLVLPPIVLLGIVLPASWSAAKRAGAATGESVARLTAANTLAATAGSLAASFLLAPTLGLWWSFGAVALLFAASGAALLWRAGSKNAAMIVGPLVAVGLVAGVMVPASVEAIPPRSDLLRRWDGQYGWVDVIRERVEDVLVMRQNIHYSLGSSRAQQRELRQGHLPLLLHPDPKDVLFLGLGTGGTAASAPAHPEVERAVAVELNPDVVEAARLYFRKATRGALDDPRVEVRVDDARHYLARTDKKFDVIVADLFVPWESQTGYLYTVEHYRQARARLKPGGIFCQWLAIYQLGEEEFETIADSMAAVFPRVTLWWGLVHPDFSVVALIGSESDLDVDDAALAARMDRLRLLPDESGDYLLQSPETFFKHFNGLWTARRPDRLNTDEHPRVEFLAPIADRDHRVLFRDALRDYERRVLSKLAKVGVDRRPSRQD